MNVHELCERSGVGPRTLRLYFAKGLLDKPVFRGARTTYDEGHLLRVLAIRRLIHEKGYGFDGVRAELKKKSDEEIRAMLAPPARAAAASAGAAAGGPWLDAERWERDALLPGLELSLRADASPAVRRLASEISTQYRGR
jgi:DNA-binding transcriptional MerR regulator